MLVIVDEFSRYCSFRLILPFRGRVKTAFLPVRGTIKVLKVPRISLVMSPIVRINWPKGALIRRVLVGLIRLLYRTIAKMRIAAPYMGL